MFIYNMPIYQLYLSRIIKFLRTPKRGRSINRLKKYNNSIDEDPMLYQPIIVNPMNMNNYQ